MKGPYTRPVLLVSSSRSSGSNSGGKLLKEEKWRFVESAGVANGREGPYFRKERPRIYHEGVSRRLLLNREMETTRPLCYVNGKADVLRRGDSAGGKEIRGQDGGRKSVRRHAAPRFAGDSRLFSGNGNRNNKRQTILPRARA